jgi:hypothetical protein
MKTSKSFKKGTISMEEIHELADISKIGYLQKSIASLKERDATIYDLLVHEGDLIIDGGLNTFKSGFTLLIVKGNLRVKGLYIDSDHPETILIVQGNMFAKNIFTRGYLEIHGNLEVDHCLIGDYNHGATYVQKDTRAQLFYPENHYFKFLNEVEFGYQLGEYESKNKKINISRDEIYKQMDNLVDEIFDFDEWNIMDAQEQKEITDAGEKYDFVNLDTAKIMELLEEGKSIVKNMK